MPSTESADDALTRKVAAMSTATEPNGANRASAEKPKPREHASIANIYAQNQIWKNKKLDEDKDFFKKLGAGHSPDFMWIGKCNFYWLVQWLVAMAGWLDVWLVGWCENHPKILNNVPHNLSLFEISNAVLGCSDARVPANEIMGEECGSVFVVRNVANLVISTDFNLMAALQYAVTVLKVPHIIVCGHYDCGGVRASMERKDTSPPLENWLRNIRDV
jgi:carbonic anhydrase